MQTIHVSPEFPLNRRMQKAVQRGKLEIACEGGENPSMGGDTPLEKSVLSLNERDNAIDYLRMAIRSLAELCDNPYAWKWVLISLHGAIYGFAVSAARVEYRRQDESIGSNVIERRVKGRKVIEYRESLRSFDAIIKICESKLMGEKSSLSSPLVLSLEQRRALRDLKFGRNRMAHFAPMLLVDVPDGKMVEHCLQVVEALALKVGIHRSIDERKNIKRLCAEGIELARNYIWADE